MQRSRNGRLAQTVNPDGTRPGRARQRALMIAALPEGDDLSELQELLRTAGVATVGQMVQHRERPHPNSYLGPGKLDELKTAIKRADGKVQVELAQLEYNLARMRGLWTHLERLGAGRIDGGIGTRGPGESQIETDRRLARDRISALRRKLDDVKGSRAVMRAERERAHLPHVALAGYTNAGKSTLLNALTGATVGVRDRLFHTLDP